MQTFLHFPTANNTIQIVNVLAKYGNCPGLAPGSKGGAREEFDAALALMFTKGTAEVHKQVQDETFEYMESSDRIAIYVADRVF